MPCGLLYKAQSLWHMEGGDRGIQDKRPFYSSGSDGKALSTQGLSEWLKRQGMGKVILRGDKAISSSLLTPPWALYRLR